LSANSALDQAAYLFGCVNAALNAIPLAWHRKVMHITDPHQAKSVLEELTNSLRKDFHDMPRKITDPNWLETLEEEP